MSCLGWAAGSIGLDPHPSAPRRPRPDLDPAYPGPGAAARRSLDQRRHLAIGRETPQLELAEDLLAVGEHLEGAALGLLEHDLRAREGLAQLGRQTGGLGLVVSLDAVLDRELHVRLEREVRSAASLALLGRVSTPGRADAFPTGSFGECETSIIARNPAHGRALDRPSIAPRTTRPGRPVLPCLAPFPTPMITKSRALLPLVATVTLAFSDRWAGDQPTYQPKAGTTVSKRVSIVNELELDDMSLEMDGQDMSEIAGQIEMS